MESHKDKNSGTIFLDIGKVHAKSIVRDCFTMEKGVVFKEADLKYDRQMLIAIRESLTVNKDFPNYLQVWIEHRLSIIEDVIYGDNNA